ncbi:MAG: DUF222 domain-containing protein [Aeromicrobium sp.]|uniref:DUF222 domain-containing protein n=1 Tax=Aeromicrobium sp. TaxID=1871063 RepID=UPI004033BDCA
MTPTDSILGLATDASRVLWRAEAAQAATVLAFVDGRRSDAVAAGRSAASAEDARQVAILEVAVELEVASGFVAHLVAATRTLTADLPTVWAAHSDGELDRAKARAIASARWRLHEVASVELLDESVLPYATTHTLSQLKGWLRRFVTRVEADDAARRRREATAQRNVTITAMDDGMSLLQAFIPTHDALLIERELSLAAKTSRAEDPDDARRLSQARADVLTDRLLGRTADTPGRGRFHVGITVSLATLLGLDDEPAVTGDGQHAIDPTLVRELATQPGTLFSRLLTDEAGGILDVTELGRFPTAPLRRALELVDGVCDIPTCDKPAEACDLDHQQPFDPDHPDRGPTTAGNLHPRCRPHHGLKTRGALPVDHDEDGTTRWHLPTRTATGRTAFTRAWRRRTQPEIVVVEVGQSPAGLEYVPAA